MTQLVLASASPARLAVLRSAGVEPVVLVSGVDEDAVTDALGDVAPERVVTELARAKAHEVLGRIEPAVAADCVVIGCDSMLFIDGGLQGKPGSVEIARDRWQSMAGRSADLLTGHCVILMRGGAVVGEESDHSGTTVHFGRPAPKELEAYLASGEPLQVAGAFTLDSLGGWFIDRIDGDPSSVIGIGLPLVRTLLGRLDLTIADLWN